MDGPKEFLEKRGSAPYDFFRNFFSDQPRCLFLNFSWSFFGNPFKYSTRNWNLLTILMHYDGNSSLTLCTVWGWNAQGGLRKTFWDLVLVYQFIQELLWRFTKILLLKYRNFSVSSKFPTGFLPRLLSETPSGFFSNISPGVLSEILSTVFLEFLFGFFKDFLLIFFYFVLVFMRSRNIYTYWNFQRFSNTIISFIYVISS